MGDSTRVPRVTFAGGEMSEDARGRADTGRYQISVEKMENAVTVKAGAATRSPGTRFVVPYKNQLQKAAFITFRRAVDDYYLLVVNGGVSRFVRHGGTVVDGSNNPIEMTVPWVEADLPNLRSAPDPEINTIFVASGSKKPQEIVRTGTTTWVCSDYVPVNGPVADQNTNQAITVQITVGSIVAGSAVTLGGVGSPFTASMVGGLMRLDDRDLSTTPEWSATELAATIAISAQRRWNGNVYEAQNSADAGPNAPVHTDGTVSAGQGKTSWKYLHSGFGFVKITGFTSANSAAGLVTSRVPDNVGNGGTGGPTYRWYPPAWSDDLGWPSNAAFQTPKLLWFRGPRIWSTIDDDDHNFNPGQQDTTDAFSEKLRPPDNSLPDIKWVARLRAIVLGTADSEWVLTGATLDAKPTAKAIDAYPLGNDGSIAQIPVAVDGGVVFVGQGGKRLHFVKLDSQMQQMNSQELSVFAEHIIGVGVTCACWQRDPNRILWLGLADGTLASMTFMPQEQIIAFARHPRANFFVEALGCLPGTGTGADEVYLGVLRTIQNQPVRYVEQLGDFFKPLDRTKPTAQGAWFLDCALHGTGSGVTIASGLGYLEGETVGVFADGAMQSDKVVSGGSITLDRACSDFLVGKRIKGYIRDLPRAGSAQGGSSAGDVENIRRVFVKLLFSGGGKVRKYSADEEANNPNWDDFWEPVVERGADDPGPWPLLFSGGVVCTIDGPSEIEARTEIIFDDALPFTLQGLTPDIDVEEND